MEYWVLDGKTPVKIEHDDKNMVDSFNNRKILRTELRSGHVISTVFLSIDHAYNSSTPVLFETMIFGSESNYTDLYCKRYTEYDGAFAGHIKLLEQINARGIESVLESGTL